MRVLIAAFLLLLLQTGPALPQPSHWSEATRRIVLDNGLTMLLLQRGDLPIVSVQALYRFGSRNERPGLTGAAHFIEHMAFRSTSEIAKQDLTNQILRWGGRWNGYTSYDQTVYGSHTPSEHLEWLIYLERQRMRHVRFDRDEVERERTSVIAEEHQYRNAPVYEMVEHRLRRAALVAHPYGSPIMGRLSDLEGVTAAELERFYRQHYAPNTLILAIVGRFDSDAAIALVRKYFADVPGDGEPTAIRTIEPEQRGSRRVIMKAGASQAHLSMLVHSPAARDERFATLLAVDGVLAGGKAPGRGAVRAGTRLHQALVQPGLATSVSTEIELSEYPAVYEIRVDVPADADLQAVEARLDQAIADAGRSVTQEEIARSIREIRAELAFAANSNRAVANLLTVYEQLDSYRLIAQLPERLGRVTADSARAFAREWLAPDRRSIGILVPEETSVPVPGQAAEDQAEFPPETPPPSHRKSTRPIPPPRLEIPPLPSPTIRVLPNGIVALGLQIPGESVHLRLRVGAGAVHDPVGAEGTALLTARLLMSGPPGAPGPAEVLGPRQVRVVSTAAQTGDLTANREFVEISATMFPEALAETARVLADAISRPAFDPDVLRRMRRSLIASLAAREDDSRWRAHRAIFENLYAKSDRYGRPPHGSSATLESLSRENLVAFHRSHYRPENLVVSVAGAIDADAALDEIARTFGRWHPATAPSGGSRSSRPSSSTRLPREASPDARASGPRRIHIPLDKAQASLAVGLPGVTRDSKEFAALSALNYLLGETGYAGRLGEALVDTGISYAVYSSLEADRGAGPILITTDAVRSREAADRIVQILADFARDGVTESELREAKGFLLGRLLFRFESPQVATETMAEIGYFLERPSPDRIAGGEKALGDFAQRVLALTVAELNRAAAQYYDPSRAVVVTAGR